MKKNVTVEQLIEVTVNETKFTEQFMAEFRESFFPIFTIDGHLEHLAQLYARGVADGTPNEFIEGYGPVQEMGIRFAVIDVETEVHP